ncbi:hypothetical protein EDC56_0552 [Sinobacterium caligoides]|uniref:SnoaL-like protein n=1 Tax=Sinobacterium caligoides TaxID=933926 RepID=A0A3N2DYT8_9GAMM|nr:hypothetical protein [Sinobacterium caligoides]ROS05030.1 hypothetical protein EDC56_0552 [Sinobacterium caligoides]
MQHYTTEQKLAVVQASPKAVAEHDRRAWLALFADYNIVEDPVGSRPHISGVFDRRDGRRGKGPLGRFYDSFIAPNTIRFDVRRDIVNGDTVIRDLNIEITMSKRVVVSVPMHLSYQLCEQGGELKISRLAAHWEILPMVIQACSFGLDSLSTMTKMGIRLLRNMGFSGMCGFMSGVRGIGHNGKVLVDELFSALNSQNANHLQLLVDSEQSGPCFIGADGVAMSSSHFVLKHPGRFSVDKVLCSGYSCSASFEYHDGERSLPGVMIAECCRHTGKITAARFYVDNAE